MTDCGCECEFEAKNREERRVLGILLAINATMFVVEIGDRCSHCGPCAEWWGSDHSRCPD